MAKKENVHARTIRDIVKQKGNRMSGSGQKPCHTIAGKPSDRPAGDFGEYTQQDLPIKRMVLTDERVIVVGKILLQETNVSTEPHCGLHCG